ncbi:ABC transporter, ferric iron-binding periplasmic protein [Calothrix sp. NIES-4101]|nr:ABC transporter, ferric iron-binding periplasmic protein [Calothrix sp. NIES-4101]
MKKLSLVKFCAGALAVVVLGTGLAVNTQQSKTLTIYSGREEKLIDPLIEKATKDLKLKIQVRYADTAELAIALFEEGNNSRADMFLAKDAGALGTKSASGQIPVNKLILPRDLSQLSDLPSTLKVLQQAGVL